MKIKPEHYNHLLNRMRWATPENIQTHRKNIIAEGKAKDIEKRVRWDLFWASGLSGYASKTLYDYINDNHIDTALKNIVKILEGQS